MVSPGMILVTGATGNVGGAVVGGLQAAGARVRILARTESKAQPLKSAGVEVVIGDLDKPGTLSAALDGVDKIFFVTPVSPDASTQAGNLIEAAKSAGTPFVVRLSALKSNERKTRIGVLHDDTEKALKSSGLPHTILRPHFFMQNTMMAAQTVQANGVIYMPFKDGRLGMIDIRDIAEVAVKILTDGSSHQGKTYTLTGPASISFHDVAAGLSKAVGKQVQYVDVPPEAARESLKGFGLPEWTLEGYLEYFKAYSEGWGDLTTREVPELLGKPARSYETFAKDFAQVFGKA